MKAPDPRWLVTIWTLTVFAVITFIGWLMITSIANAQNVRWPGPYPVEVIEVKDGDTVEVRALAGCPFCVDKKVSVRILGIDAGESRRCRSGTTLASAIRQNCALCDKEAEAGKKAKEFVSAKLGSNATRIVRALPDKYFGRVVAELEYLEGGVWKSVGRELVAQDGMLAVLYGVNENWELDRDLTKEKPWCEGIKVAQ